MSLADEVRAIRGGAGVIDRSGRGLVRVRGADRTSFLQAMVTNDVARLAAGQGCYALHLTVKGKVVADMAVYACEDSFLLETGEGVGPKLARALEERVVMEDVEVVDQTGAFGVVGIYGPRAFAAAGTLPLAPFAHRAFGGGVAAGDASTGESGVHLCVPRDGVAAQLARLRAAGAASVSAEAVAVACVEAGTPRYGADFGEDTIPIEANLAHAISLTKGCYVGQEVIARATARGHANWRLVGLAIDGDEPPAPDTVASSPHAAEAARVTSSVRSPTLGRTIALAHAFRTVPQGAVLRLPDGRAAKVVGLPFYRPT